jgi:hypothetical protein
VVAVLTDAETMRGVAPWRALRTPTMGLVVAVHGWGPEVDVKHGLNLREGVDVGVGESAQGAADRAVVHAGCGGESPEGESALGHHLVDGAGDGVGGDGSDGCVVVQGAVGEGHAGVGLVVDRWATVTGGHWFTLAISPAVLAFSPQSWERGGYMHHGFEGGADQPAQSTNTLPEGAPLRAHTEETATWTTPSPSAAVSS